jgi:AcrR family transcriptional regulator
MAWSPSRRSRKRFIELSDPSPPRRRKGRPAGTSHSVGTETITLAARTLLGRLPPARVSLTAIAREAGVDPALIRYYFKNRSNLLRVILEDLQEQSDAPGTFDPSRDPLDQLRDHCRGFFRFIDANAYVHRLMLDEIAHVDSPERRDLLVRLNMHARKFFGEVVEAVRVDENAPTIEPLLVHIALIGMTEFFGAAKPILEAVIGPGLDIDRLRRDYVDFISTALAEGLRRKLA